VLLGLYSLGGARGFAVYSAQVFFGAAVFYLCFGLGSVVLVRRRMASANVQTILQAGVDMLVLVLLLHTCGGVASGLGVFVLGACRRAGIPAAAAQRLILGGHCRDSNPRRHHMAAARRH